MCMRQLQIAYLPNGKRRCFFHRIDDPVFPNACVCVKVQLFDIVMTETTGRNNFNDLVWCSGTALVGEFAAVAYDTDIRLSKWHKVTSFQGEMFNFPKSIQNPE